jgi:hypothetical protein
LVPRRPKARGLVQHGGPPGWLWEIDPAGVTLWVMGGTYRLAAYLFRTVPVSLTGAAQLQADVQELPSCELMNQELPSCALMEYPANVHNHPSLAM